MQESMLLLVHLLELHLPKIISLVVILRLLICWGCLKVAARGRRSRHVLHKIHRLSVVLNYVLGLGRVLQWRRILLLLLLIWSSWVEGFRLAAESVERIHLVYVPLVTKANLVGYIHHFVFNCLSLGWLLLLAKVEKPRLVLKLLLKIDLIHKVSQAMNLNLLYLVSVFSDFLILIHILQLKLTLDIELESLNQVFVGAFQRLLCFCCLFTLLFLEELALVLVQLVFDLVLNVIEIQGRDAMIRVLSNLNLNFFFRT